MGPSEVVQGGPTPSEAPIDCGPSTAGSSITLEHGPGGGVAISSNTPGYDGEVSGATGRPSRRNRKPPTWRKAEGLSRDELQEHIPLSTDIVATEESDTPFNDFAFAVNGGLKGADTGFQELKSGICAVDGAEKSGGKLAGRGKKKLPANGPRRKASTKAKKKAVKQETGAVVVIPTDTAIGIVAGDTAEEALNAAVDIIDSTHMEEFSSEDENGQKITKTKRKAILIAERRLKADQKKLEKSQFGGIKQNNAIAATVAEYSTATFEAFEEGPKRAPEPQIPADLDQDSPFALFSLFFTEEMFQTIATNTNAYALQQLAIPRGRDSQGTRLPENDSNQRAWWATNAAEIKVFVGCLIYMGVHQEGELSDYWKHKDPFHGRYPSMLTRLFTMLIDPSGPVHSPQVFMAYDRFTQLQRFFHISAPIEDAPLEPSDEEVEAMTEEELEAQKLQWWHKMKPLLTPFRNNCQKYWKPGSNVAIDEMMVRFFGRSKHTVDMRNKPIKRGYKFWALCEAGYLYNFIYYSRTLKTGELKRHEGLTDTGSMIYQLALTLPPLPSGETYTLYLDNLFTSISLFHELRIKGIGACGTTRVSNSVNFPAILEVMREKWGHKLPWGTLVAIPVDDVMCLGWIDNNTVLSLSTVHTVDKASDVITKWRKRPGLTSTNAKEARKPFNGRPRAVLEVPRHINDYNYNMGSVDIADQYRQTYKTQRKAMRNWWPIFYWVLDHSIINGFKIGSNEGYYWKKRQHKDFRIRLYEELFAFKEDAEVNKHTDYLGHNRFDQTIIHAMAELQSDPTLKHKQRKRCAWCKHQNTLADSRSRTPSPKKRAFGDPLNSNIPTKKKQIDRTAYGCSGCQVALCIKEGKDCWERWHGLKQAGF